MERMENPYEGQVLAWTDFASGYGIDLPKQVDHIFDANIATSIVDRHIIDGAAARQMHKPMLDIDLPVKVVPSSTPGHFHLFIDKEMTWGQYERLLRVLGDVGILQPGYVGASIAKGFTSLRLPWIKKEN